MCTSAHDLLRLINRLNDMSEKCLQQIRQLQWFVVMHGERQTRSQAKHEHIPAWNVSDPAPSACDKVVTNKKGLLKTINTKLRGTSISLQQG